MEVGLESVGVVFQIDLLDLEEIVQTDLDVDQIVLESLLVGLGVLQIDCFLDPDVDLDQASHQIVLDEDTLVVEIEDYQTVVA